MKTATEMRQEAAGSARKAAYALVGAPVLAGRKLAEAARWATGTARKEFDTCAEEGERVTSRLRERGTVDDIKERVDFSQFQDRVGRLRDQLEDVLAQWRESFTARHPDGTGEPEAEPAEEVSEPAAEAQD